MSSSEEPIRAGWYVDGVNKRVRLDSYGIPEGEVCLISPSLISGSVTPEATTGFIFMEKPTHPIVTQLSNDCHT